VAVASIMVDYILTACISAVSAVLNATSFPAHHDHRLVLVTIWVVAGLNILGIKENAVTFTIFIFATLIFVTLIISGVLALDGASLGRLKQAAVKTGSDLNPGSFFQSYHIFIAHIAFCILAYSGVESVLQTAGLVRSWREIQGLYLPGRHGGLVTPSWRPGCRRPSISTSMKAYHPLPPSLMGCRLASWWQPWPTLP
jgi:amino acid transporter